MKKTFYLYFLFGFLLLPADVIASGCDLSEPCAAYSRADAVFTGKLTKIMEQDEKNSLPLIVKLSFSVETVFKGQVSKEVLLDFSTAGGERTFSLGQKYFVYKEKNNAKNPCNATHLFSKDDPHLIYAEYLLKNKQALNISGKIKYLSADEIKNVKLTVNDGKSRRRIKIDDWGGFSLFVIEKRIYSLEIHLPFRADVEVTRNSLPYDVKVINSGNITVIKYSVNFVQGACEHREIEFFKK